MKPLVKNTAKIMMFLLAAIIITGGATSCKSKKKLAREKSAAEYTMKVEQAKRDLTAMLNGTTNWSLEEQDNRLNVIKSYNIDDDEVIDLITKVESKISMDKAEAERKDEEDRLKREEDEKIKDAAAKYEEFDNQLNAISKSTTIDAANKKITLSLEQFATPDVPVLIIISQYGGVNDYDRPTTISKFLNYLKDKKQYQYQVESVKRDGLGKITEVELIKK
ncbi:MAG: hypothetical protein H8E34_07750 [Bacteroidetes bacterium]|nr:hypothetical protein [Bacteroidota bacterium]MBL6943350.1 hypothetical protein [Bacteroidales bacterium]